MFTIMQTSPHKNARPLSAYSKQSFAFAAEYFNRSLPSRNIKSMGVIDL